VLILLLVIAVAVWLGIMSARATDTDEFLGFVARARTFQLRLRIAIGYALMIIAGLAVVGSMFVR
jgi:hypothetical protein